MTLDISKIKDPVLKKRMGLIAKIVDLFYSCGDIRGLTISENLFRELSKYAYPYTDENGDEYILCNNFFKLKKQNPLKLMP